MWISTIKYRTAAGLKYRTHKLGEEDSPKATPAVGSEMKVAGWRKLGN